MANKKTGEAKTKKEKTFNTTKVARQVEKSLKSAFPKGKFFVSDDRPVEVIVKDGNGYTQQELNVFHKVFCTLSKIDTADLVITFEKVDPKPAQETAKPDAAPAPAAAK